MDSTNLNWLDSVVAEVMNNNQVSRRTLLKGAGALSALAMVSCGTKAAVSTGVDKAADVATLNALLTAEYRADKAYAAGAGVLAGVTASDSHFGIRDPILEIAKHWKAQHIEHAEVLKATITAAGGTPIDVSSIPDFAAPTGFTGSVLNVMRLAANAERGAAVAYNGAIKAMKSADNRFLAAAIEGDESQHFVVLYVLLKGTAGPGTLNASTYGKVVPASFVSSVGMSSSLNDVPDLPINA